MGFAMHIALVHSVL